MFYDFCGVPKQLFNLRLSVKISLSFSRRPNNAWLKIIIFYSRGKCKKCNELTRTLTRVANYPLEFVSSFELSRKEIQITVE